MYDCLTRLAGGDVATPETTNFTGEFEPAKTSEPETEVKEVAEEVKKEEISEEEPQPAARDDNEAKVLALIKKMDEGDGIYYDDLGIAISLALLTASSITLVLGNSGPGGPAPPLDNV